MKYLVVIWSSAMLTSMSFVPYVGDTIKEIAEDSNVAYDKAIDAKLCLTGPILKDFIDGVDGIDELKNGDIVILEPELTNLMEVMI